MSDDLTDEDFRILSVTAALSASRRFGVVTGCVSIQPGSSAAASNRVWTHLHTLIYSMPVKARIRELLAASPFQPFVIRMADGREYRIDHPDFVLAPASQVPQITIEESDGRQHFLSVLLITSVERATPAAAM
jgi:hypothetical protein